MSFFGLFGHDKNPGALSGASQFSAISQTPNISGGMSGDLAGGFQVPQAQSFAEPQLPPAPPSVKAPSLFDKDHRQESLLALASGLLSGQNFSDGVGNAARALLQEKQGIRKANQPVVGGPDDAFEIYTNPDGSKRYVPIQAATDYLHKKATDAAALKDKGPTAKDNLDAIGRLASVVSKYDPKDQPQAWAEGRAHLAELGFDGIPDAYHPQYTAYGAAVPTMIRAETAQAAQGSVADHRKVQEAQGAARIAQGGARLGLQAQSVAQSGVRVGLAQDANRRAENKANGVTVIDGYEVRLNPLTGKYQRRKAQ